MRVPPASQDSGDAVVEIALSPVSSRQFHVLLGGQHCRIRHYLADETLYLDLDVAETRIASGNPCLHAVPLPRRRTHLFRGVLMFIDTLDGACAPPRPEGLGQRWRLYWIAPGIGVSGAGGSGPVPGGRA